MTHGEGRRGAMESTGNKERMPNLWADEDNPKDVFDRYRILLQEMELEIAWLKNMQVFWEIKADRLKNAATKDTKEVRRNIAICLAESRRCEGTIRMYQQTKAKAVRDFKKIMTKYEGDYIGQEWAERFLKDGKGW